MNADSAQIINPPAAHGLDAAKLAAGLDALIKKQREGGNTLKALVRKLRPKLRKARRHGVTYKKLADWLSTQGAKISVSTLKTYLDGGTKRPSRKPRANRKVQDSRPDSQSSPNAKAGSPSTAGQTPASPPPLIAPAKVA